MTTWVIVVGLLLGSVLAAAEADPDPDAVVAVVVAAPDAAGAARALTQRFGWSPRQVDAVLGLDLGALAAMDAAALATILAANEVDGDQRLIDLAAKRLSAGGGMLLPTGADGQPGRLDGGVRFELDRVVIAAEAIDFTLAGLPAGGPFLATALLAAAPDGRVLIDTSRSRFESLDFRGVLSPGSVMVERLEVEPDAAAVAYRLVLEDLGPFSGQIRDEDGAWLPVSGDGGRMVIGLRAVLVSGRPADPTLSRIAIIGDPGVLELVEARQVLRVRSSEIELRFAAGGGLAAVETGADSEVEGRPHAVDALPEHDAE